VKDVEAAVRTLETYLADPTLRVDLAARAARIPLGHQDQYDAAARDTTDRVRSGIAAVGIAGPVLSIDVGTPEARRHLALAFLLVRGCRPCPHLAADVAHRTAQPVYATPSLRELACGSCSAASASDPAVIAHMDSDDTCDLCGTATGAPDQLWQQILVAGHLLVFAYIGDCCQHLFASLHQDR
jgi:hypothetical protein